jgi:hypothetical protein
MASLVLALPVALTIGFILSGRHARAQGHANLGMVLVAAPLVLLGLAALLGLDEAEARTAGALEQELHADDCL